MATSLYTPQFYRHQAPGSGESATIVLPYLLDRLQATSMIDIGCGAGTWLRAARDWGITDLVGIDGEWRKQQGFSIEGIDLRFQDLDRKIDLGRRFDLASCLEVAEHLRPERADSLVADLAALSDVVFFSAAVPGQGGSGHINEQPQSYWIERFRRQGMAVLDVLRPVFWHDDRIECWYRQNALLFVHASKAGQIADRFEADRMPPLVDVIHPALYRAATSMPMSEQVKQRLRKLLGRA